MSKRDWAIKYRPKSLKRVVGNEDIMKDMKRFARNGNFPNMLFIGPPGIGKTTVAKLVCIAAGIPYYEINASSDSGINVIRDEVKNYAQQMDIRGASFKAIIFDQVDRLTTHAQQASLQLAEEVSDYCRFLATSNDIRNLHQAFMSRFKVYRFMPIDPPDMVTVLGRILRREGIPYETETLYIIARSTRGDLRQAIKILQATAEGRDKLDPDDAKSWAWVPPYRKIRECITIAMTGKFKKAVTKADAILKLTQPRWFFTGLTDQLFKGKRFTDEQRKIICTLLPRGNPFSMVDLDVYRFLAEIAREFEEE